MHLLENYAACEANIDDPKDATALLDFENVLFAIRSDLGYDNDQVRQGDLLKVFLKDVDVDKIIQICQQRQLPSTKEDKSYEHA